MARAYLIACMLWVVAPVAAQEIRFEASVDRTRLGQSEPLQLTLRIVSDESLSHVPSPNISLGDFHVQGPAISTRMEMINFSTSFTRELGYTLYAKRRGKMRLGPATIEIGGKTYQTRPIEVEITRGSRKNAKRSAGKDGEFVLEDHLFVQARSDRKRAYVGQQVTVDFDLFYRFQLHNVGFKEIPSFAGFWIKELFVAQQLQADRKVVEGVTFNVAPLRRMALFPTSAGKHAVESMVVSCEIPARRSRRGNLLDDFFASDPFFGRTQSALLQSERLDIEVLPLPDAGRPVEFTGAVGRFDLTAHAQPTHVKAGDPVTLRVAISGQGNMSAVKVPEIQGAEGIKMYEPTLEEEEQISNGNYGGRRIFEFILIPETSGMMEIPPVRFAYFDPVAEKYLLLQSAPIFIHSEGEIVEAGGEAYGLSRKDIEAVGRDIHHIKPDAQELSGAKSLYTNAAFWLLQAGIPLAFFALFFRQRHQQRLEGDVAYARRRRARGEAGKHLKRADELLEAGESTAYYSEVQRAVLAFLADHLNLAAAGLTVDACEVVLRQRSVGEDTIDALRTWLARCDYARFAQGIGAQGDRQEVREQAEKLIAALERKI
ncbi:MAG: BatD family protein [Candidatus Latescibacterota bacterium]|jgi:hypothetical protein